VRSHDLSDCWTSPAPEPVRLNGSFSRALASALGRLPTANRENSVAACGPRAASSMGNRRGRASTAGSDWKQSFRLFRHPAATDPYGKLSIRVVTRYSVSSEAAIGRFRASTLANGANGSQANACADRRGCPPRTKGTDSGGISSPVPARTTVLLIADVDRTHSKPSRNQESQPTPHHRPRHRGAERFAGRR